MNKRSLTCKGTQLLFEDIIPISSLLFWTVSLDRSFVRIAHILKGSGYLMCDPIPSVILIGDDDRGGNVWKLFDQSL